MAFKYVKRSQETVEQRASQKGGNFESFVKDDYRMYTPKKGDNSIRILPRDASENAQHYGEDVYVHYGIGPDKGSVLCNKMLGDPCPICEVRTKAERRGDEDAVRELRAARRVLIWLIDRKQEDQGPLLWAMPWTVDRDMNKAAKDRETGRYYLLDDPEEGYDLYFERDGEGLTTKYIAYQLARRPSRVDPKFLDYIEKNPLLDTLMLRSYDEVHAIFSGEKAGDSKGGADSTRRESSPEDSRRDVGRDEPIDDIDRRDPPRELEQRGLPPQEAEPRSESVRDDSPVWQEQEQPKRVSLTTTTRPQEESSSSTATGASRAAALREKFAAQAAAKAGRS